MPLSLAEHMDSLSLIKVYGQPIDGFPASALTTKERENAKGAASVASIRAYSVGGYCLALPKPALLLVFGDGKLLDKDDGCGKAGETAWSVDRDQTILIDMRVGDALELLEEYSTKGVSGGVAIEDPRIENGTAKATIRIWAKIEIFGAKVSVDERIPVSVPLEGCHTVFEFGFGNVDLCVRGASAGVNLCAKLCVGKWGISKCWDVCTYVGFPGTLPTTSQPGCNCTE